MAVTAPAPNGKTEVVTHDRTNPPSLPRTDQQAFTSTVGLLFLRHPEEVALVVRSEVSTRLHPQQPIVIAVMHIADEASQDERAGLIGHLTHPPRGSHVHNLSQSRSSHREPGREHLRENDHVCGTANAPDFLLEHGQVGADIFPVQIGLYDRDVEVRHSSAQIKQMRRRNLPILWMLLQATQYPAGFCERLILLSKTKSQQLLVQLVLIKYGDGDAGDLVLLRHF